MNFFAQSDNWNGVGMTDQQFIAWSNRLITTIACYYIAYGGWLLLRAPVLAAFDKGGLQ